MKTSYHPCNPIQCIIPPHMVDTIKLRGDTGQKEMASAIEREAEKSRDDRQAAEPPKVHAAALVPLETEPSPKIEVYDANNGTSLPGTLVRDKIDVEAGDAAVNEAFDGSKHTYYLYLDNYRRDSLDGNGMTLVSTVHYGRDYNNAFWNGSQMAYGDGDGVIFNSFTKSLSVIGHELSHGVVQFSGGLIYQDQSGALNESFADVFGCLTVQKSKNQSASEADWLIGGELLGPGIKGKALRSMKAPGTAYDDSLIGKDPQPFHMDGYVATSRDRGGVHINSGIPNHAFYLLSQYLGGNAWEKAGQIWYDTMQDIENPNASFSDWADKTIEMARQRYGPGSSEVLFTRRAWKLVGVSV